MVRNDKLFITAEAVRNMQTRLVHQRFRREKQRTQAICVDENIDTNAAELQA
jgi:hypothetical protein